MTQPMDVERPTTLIDPQAPQTSLFGMTHDDLQTHKASLFGMTQDDWQVWRDAGEERERNEAHYAHAWLGMMQEELNSAREARVATLSDAHTHQTSFLGMTQDDPQ